jgi:hypothetical protein
MISLLPSWIIFPEAFSAFMARVMLIPWVPVKKLKTGLGPF